VRIGEDWTSDEVQTTVTSYFEMLRLEAAQQRYTNTEFNAQLRQHLRGRTRTLGLLAAIRNVRRLCGCAAFKSAAARLQP